MGRGLLVFKGDKPKKKKKKSKHERPDKDESPAAATPSTSPREASQIDKSPQKPAAVPSKPSAAAAVAAVAPKIHTGRGRITTSGTVVTGLDTKFSKDLRQGDALLVAIGGQDEMRVITMLLSDMSINLSSPFSQNLMQPTAFRYISKPRNAQREAKQAREKAALDAVEEEAKASGTGASHELVYRERTEHGSYRIRRKQLDSEMSREELLNLRSKKTSDKYC